MRELRLATRVRLDTEASEALDEFHGRPVLLVTDDFLAITSVYQKVVDRLSKRVTTFTGMKPNPSTSEISAEVSVYLQFGPDVVVAYGGGSVIDTAKVMHKAALDAGFRASEGIVAVPTTSGSGSEMTSLAIVTDGQTHTKVPIASSELVVRLAILDPEAVVGVPPHIIVDSSMGVSARVVEAYVTSEACDFSNALAEKAVKLVSGNLERYYAHGDDLEARSHMYNAFCIAAMAFDNADLGIVHSLAHVLGGHYPVAHGRLNALLLPHVTEFNAARSNRAVECYTCLNRPLYPSTRGRAAVMSLIGAVERSRPRLGIPSRLSDLKVASEVLRRGEGDLVATAFTDGYTMTTSVAPSPDDLRGIPCRIA